MRITLAMFAIPLAAQSVTITYDLQPLQSFEAALLAKLPGVALYSEISCSTIGEAQVLPAGRILQYSKISWVDKSLADLTIERARSRSRTGRLLKVVGYLSVGAGVIGSPAWRVVSIPQGASAGLSAAGPILTVLGAYISGDFSRSGARAADLNLLRANEQIGLGPRACDSRLFLGAYQRGFLPHSATI